MRRLIFVCSSPSFLKPDPEEAEPDCPTPQEIGGAWTEFVADDLQERELLPSYLVHTGDESGRAMGAQIAKRARDQRRFPQEDHKPKRARAIPILKQQRLLPFDRPDFSGDLPRELWREIVQLIFSMLDDDQDCIGLIIAAEPTLKRLRQRLEPLLRTSIWKNRCWLTELTLQNDARGFLHPPHLPRR